MITKVPVNNLKEGMVIAKDIFLPTPIYKEGKVIGYEHDVEKEFQSLIAAGYVLDKKLIELCKNHLEYVEIQTRSILVSFDETVINSVVIKDIKINGRLRINAKISPNISIIASNKIIIESNIPQGCTIESETAEIVVKGDLIGTQKSPIRLKAFHSVTALSAAFTEISSGGIVMITNDVINSVIIAKGTITVHGSVINSKLQTQESIKINNCGSVNKKGLSHLIIKTDSYAALNDKFATEVVKTPILIKDINQQAIEISKLKSQMKELLNQGQKASRDKKKLLLEQLVTSEKELKEAKYDLRLQRSKLVDISCQLIDQLLQNKIIISGALYPSASISIETFTIQINNILEKVIFYIHDADKTLKYKVFTHLP